MLFTIIIPVYNRAEKVKPTLASVLAQTYRPLQVVLVDNDSSDDSLSVLQEFQAQHSADGFEVVVAQESHHTASATRNRGFAEAKGDWVLFFDSDDTMRPTLVESYRNAITQHGGALDLVATKACLHSLDGNLRNLPFSPPTCLPTKFCIAYFPHSVMPCAASTLPNLAVGTMMSCSGTTGNWASD